MAHSGKTQTQVQKQGQDELMYIVREDTLNFIGILFEALAVYDYFKDPQHQMCQTFKNRLITQINLSNGIYFEQRENGQEINQLKLDAADKIKKVLSTVQIDSGRFTDLIDHHLNKNLLKMNGIDQIKGNFDQQPTKLSDANVQNIVNAMNHQDQQFNKLSKGQMKCEQVSQIELLTQAQIKYASALQQLEKNFNQQRNGLAEKLPYVLTQKIVQQWLDAAYDQKLNLNTIYNNIPKPLWQDILQILNQNYVNGISSAAIPKIISSIEQYLKNNKLIIGPEKAKDRLNRLEEFNKELQKQIQ